MGPGGAQRASPSGSVATRSSTRQAVAVEATGPEQLGLVPEGGQVAQAVAAGL